MIRHNPPLPGLPVHALPVLNLDRTNHNTNPMEHWCIATVVWTSCYCMTSSLCWWIDWINLNQLTLNLFFYWGWNKNRGDCSCFWSIGRMAFSIQCKTACLVILLIEVYLSKPHQSCPYSKNTFFTFRMAEQRFILLLWRPKMTWWGCWYQEELMPQ